MVLVEACDPAKCGKAFRESLRRPSPVLPPHLRRRKTRIVPAFTIQAMQRGTKVQPPPKSTVFVPQRPRPTMFRKCYLRGEFPIGIEFEQGGKRLCWKVPVEKLDYHHYLPMFFDGLAEGEYPFNFFVDQGIKDLITKGSYKVLPVVPQLIIPIKNALATKRSEVMCLTLKALQRLVMSCDRVGEALVPYFRQILPVLNLFKDINCSAVVVACDVVWRVVRGVDVVYRRVDEELCSGRDISARFRDGWLVQHTGNIGSGIDHTASRGENVGDLIEETLQVLERYGGVDAFINIKYMVPTYESCVLN